MVMAFEEVCPERIDLIHKNYRKLCNLLIDVEEWGQVVIISMLTRYARTQFLSPTQNVSAARAPRPPGAAAPPTAAVAPAGVSAGGEPREGLLRLGGGRGQGRGVGGGVLRSAAGPKALRHGPRPPAAAAQHQAPAAEPQRRGGHGGGAALLPPGAQGRGGRHRQGARAPAAEPQVRSPRPGPAGPRAHVLQPRFSQRQRASCFPAGPPAPALAQPSLPSSQCGPPHTGPLLLFGPPPPTSSLVPAEGPRYH